MPHDACGKPLKDGDLVRMVFRVRSVSPAEADCNVLLEALDFAASGQSYLPTLTCNAKLTEKCAPE